MEPNGYNMNNGTLEVYRLILVREHTSSILNLTLYFETESSMSFEKFIDNYVALFPGWELGCLNLIDKV